MKEQEVNSLCESDDKFDKRNRYKYKKDNLTYYEFHVDDHDSFQTKLNRETMFGVT